MKIMFTFALALTLAIVSASCAPQSSQPSPNISSSPSSSHSMNGMQKMDEMNERGDKVMGFDHMKTTHHFRFLVDGGAIEVEANDAADTASGDQIRQHLELHL